jgi:hypothetical protein
LLGSTASVSVASLVVLIILTSILSTGASSTLIRMGTESPPFEQVTAL